MSVPQEVEPELRTSAPILWGDDYDAGVYPAAELDAHQHALATELRRGNRHDLERVVAAINAQRTLRHVMPLWVTGNGASDRRSLNNFPAPGQWILESVVCWADPAATANLTLTFTLDATIAIPIPLALSKTGAVALPIGLPVIDNDQLSWTSAGGVSTDRGAVLLVFKREG